MMKVASFKTLIFAVAVVFLLSLSGCTAQPDGPPASEPPQADQSEQIAELEARLADAEAELERLENQYEFGEYAYYTMIREEPEFTQAIVDSPDGILTSPVELGLKCGSPMRNAYVEVVAKCRIKANTTLIEPPEEWLLVQCAGYDASSGTLGWIPAECAVEYTAENMNTVTFPLKIDETKMDWDHGVISVSSIDDGVANIGYVGGGAESIPAEYILRPTPGVTGWFDQWGI